MACIARLAQRCLVIIRGNTEALKKAEALNKSSASGPDP